MESETICVYLEQTVVDYKLFAPVVTDSLTGRGFAPDQRQ